jgi:CheY-like chemotaxis protein
VNIEWQASGDVWKAFADRAQLELALVNLIINARDAMPAGGTVTISSANRKLDSANWAELPHGDYVQLTVSDTGSGMAPEVLEKVLEPFFTTKELGKGSGLGLPMVYGFAKQSNGAFRIRSEVGEGTTAELWLPRAPHGEAAETLPPKEETARRISRRLRILLVDDHEEVRSTTAAVLHDLGHEVIEAADGAEALERMRGGDCQYDLVISDYAMPRLSGTDFVRSARELCPGLPALIITGYAEAESIKDRPDGVEILLKPFTANKLESVLGRVCEAQTAAAAE